MPRKKRLLRQLSFMEERLHEVGALLLVVAAFYMTLCLLSFSNLDPSFNRAAPAEFIYNAGGLWGGYMADSLMMFLGYFAFAVPAAFLVWAYFMGVQKVRMPWFTALFAAPIIGLALVAIATLLPRAESWVGWQNATNAYGNGGLLGSLIAGAFLPRIGELGSWLFFGTIVTIATMWLTGLSVYHVADAFTWLMNRIKLAAMVTWRKIKRFKVSSLSIFQKPERQQLAFDIAEDAPSAPLPRKTPKAAVAEIDDTPMVPQSANMPDATARNRSKHTAVGEASEEAYAGEYNLPSLDLLSETPTQQDAESQESLQANARRIEAELKHYGVEGAVTKVRPGPVITIYELEPAAGVKTSQVLGLADDLARAMSAQSIRIATMPGRNVIGIEVPNAKRQMVTLRQLLETQQFMAHSGAMTVAMGVDTTGHPIYADIAKMPHALIAGTTGSGKSVAVNAFLLSLFYRMPPERLRVIMIDPKMLELSIYNDIPHLLTPVITDPNKAASALNWAVKEMENRYRLMSELGVKNIDSFNAKFTELQAQDKIPSRLVQTGFDVHTGQPKYEEQPLAESTMPHILIVIDELADLMMVAGKQVEMSIARLTQMARASGMHLMVATQRPSVNVVTGLIKANIPTRISFSVASKIDSRTVLDSMGAEQLLGKGDMLYLPNGSNTISRLHGAFVDEDECVDVANHLKKQGKPQFVTEIDGVSAPSGASGAPSAGGAPSMAIPAGGTGSEGDDLYQQAIQIVAQHQKASTSFLQRHLKIGYNRAATMIEQLEEDGFIGAANHVGQREIILQKPDEAA